MSLELGGMFDKKKKFLIELCSDLNFEEMVVDISLNNERIAMVNYDKGIDNIEIELFVTKESSLYTFPLTDFLEVLEKAKAIAIKCAKEDEERKNEIS